MRHAPRLWPPPQRSTNSLTRTIDTPIIRSIFRTVLLFEGRRRRRAEDGAAVRDEGGDAPSVSSDETGKPGSLMRRPRAGLVTPPPGGPGQPSAGTKTGCPMSGAARGGDEGAVATAPDRGPTGGICRRSEARLKGTENAASGAPGGASSRSQGPRGRLRTVSRAASPAAQEDSQSSASAGAPLPSTRDAKNCNFARAYPAPTKEYGR